MQCLEYSKKRLTGFLEEIRRLKGSEFPYKHAENALDLIETRFSDYHKKLNQLSSVSNSSTVKAACAAELTSLWEYLPLLGFILRSTNTRNAFEVHGPLLRLAREIVKPDVKLIFSSEWDYSPLTYIIGITHLPNYVLIGFPAHEADNPLILPLAAHELGHSVWAAQNLRAKFGVTIETKIIEDIKNRWAEYHTIFQDVSSPTILQTDIFAQQTWSPAVTWAEKQAEETFCDFTGLFIFRESYLHAFAYLLAPKQLWTRSVIYPNLGRRVDNLIKAAGEFGIQVPHAYRDEFDDLPPISSLDRQQVFLLSLADAASARLTDDLIKEARLYLSTRIHKPASEPEKEAIYKDFQVVAPASNSGCLANILNAGWKAFHDPDLWKDVPQIQSKHKTLKELILKSLEVFEYEELLKVPL